MIAVIFHNFTRLLMLVIVVDVVLSYFMAPYHPVRRTLDRIVQPMLRPIQRVVKPVSGMDFSPVVLVIAIGLIDQIVNYLF